MKAMISGVWHAAIDPQIYVAARRDAEPEPFRHWVTAAGDGRFTAEAGRYHLYVSYACPFAHRVILYRGLLGLESVISQSVVHPRWTGPDGWVFAPDPAYPEVGADPVCGENALWKIYRRAKPDFTGKVTVPVLWDRRHATIVSSESAEIMRMMDTAFAGLGQETPQAPGLAGSRFRPAALAEEVDELGGFIRARVNGAVYGAGFAPDQTAYDRAMARLHEALDSLETLLSDARPYLLGKDVTEADWLLFPTLVRWDAVYYGALRLNQRRLADFPALAAWTARLYAFPGVAASVRLAHAKRHYYDDLDGINPTVVPPGPAPDFLSAA